MSLKFNCDDCCHDVVFGEDLLTECKKATTTSVSLKKSFLTFFYMHFNFFWMHFFHLFLDAFPIILYAFSLFLNMFLHKHIEVGVAIGGVASCPKNCFFKVGNYAVAISMQGERT